MRYTPRELRHPISLYAFINLLTRFHSYFLTWFPVELKYSEFSSRRRFNPIYRGTGATAREITLPCLL
jgi:hypothetical protein